MKLPQSRNKDFLGPTWSFWTKHWSPCRSQRGLEVTEANQEEARCRVASKPGVVCGVKTIFELEDHFDTTCRPQDRTTAWHSSLLLFWEEVEDLLERVQKELQMGWHYSRSERSEPSVTNREESSADTVWYPSAWGLEAFGLSRGIGISDPLISHPNNCVLRLIIEARFVAPLHKEGDLFQGPLLFPVVSSAELKLFTVVMVTMQRTQYESLWDVSSSLGFSVPRVVIGPFVFQ